MLYAPKKTLFFGKWEEDKAEGLEKRREEGHREAIWNVARQLKSKGLSPEEITAVSGIEAREIARL